VIVGCPQCGAEVEFRYDDSFVRVCGHCRSAVARTDRGVETLGAFADLVPMASALRLFAEGRYGSAGFLLIDMAQLRHAAGGVWQEWYAKLDGGQWAWISEAQGRLYLTMERPDVAAPPAGQLAPGAQVELAGAMYTVAERGTATYTAAQGEIPYRLVPGSSYGFVDLSDGRGGFATIDYGDGSAPATVYLGAQVTPAGLGIHGGEAAPELIKPATGARLACPNCGGGLELRAPDASLRVACPYCATLVSVEGGTLAIIAAQAKKPTPAIPLGTVAKLAEGELTVIGFLVRSAYVDGVWYPFEEYLLYAPAVGFRWLVCSDGHWSYVQPIAPGAVKTGALQPTYDGVTFQPFQYSVVRVDAVLGEAYWRVAVGERVHSADYIAPPAMLSREASASEENWSLATYLTPDEVQRAVGKPLTLGVPVGIAPNQPGPKGIGKVIWAVSLLVLALASARCVTSHETVRLAQSFVVPMHAGMKPAATDPNLGAVPADPAIDPSASPAAAGSDAPSEPPGAVMFSDEFQLEGGRNVKFELSANVSNNWVYAALDLTNPKTGDVISLDKSIEYYSGYDDEGSWSEGGQTASEVIGPVAAGTYVLRVEAQHGGVGDVDLHVAVREGVFRWMWFWLAVGVLAVPFGLAGLASSSFQRRRWQNSSLSALNPPPDGARRPVAPRPDDQDDEEDDDA
jgi:hypothetical protein